MNHACKHDFLDLHNLSRFHDHILIVMIFRYFPFEVCFVNIIKSDIMMMKYVIRVEPFDVLIKNRMANMTLVVCASRLVDEPQVRRAKGWHTADQRTNSRRKLSTWKTVHKNIFKTEIFLS